jgi:DnaK suppressor protein
MNDVDRARFRAAIEAEQLRTAQQVTSLRKSFTDIVESTDSISTDDEHDPEGATIAYERSQVSALLRRYVGELAALDDALRHIDDCDSTRCQACGADIVLERLLTLPHVRTCVECARRR